MTGYVALMRGINVGGHKKVPMADLRALFADLGFPDARTYIQSGNVVFDADEAAPGLRTRLEAGIVDRFGFEVPVLLRTAAELDALDTHNPFAERGCDPAKLVVTFLSHEPSPDVREALVVPDGLPEEAVVLGAELFIHYPNGMGRSALDRSGFWKPLGETVTTTRNWRTVMRLRELLAT